MEDEQIVSTPTSGGKKPSVLLTVLAVLFLLLVGGYLFMNNSKVNVPQSEQNTEPPAVSMKPVNQVIVTDYSAGESVNVAVVILANAGFAVVHEDNKGQPGEVIGVSDLLLSGEGQNVAIDLFNEIKDGDTVHVVLHQDNGDSKFVEADDAVVNDDEGSPVVASYLVGAGQSE